MVDVEPDGSLVLQLYVSFCFFCFHLGIFLIVILFQYLLLMLFFKTRWYKLHSNKRGVHAA